MVFENNGHTTTAKTFLNIADRGVSGGERGLLGLAFHPDYATNGYFYVDYTTPDSLRTHVSRFQVTSNPVMRKCGMLQDMHPECII